MRIRNALDIQSKSGPIPWYANGHQYEILQSNIYAVYSHKTLSSFMPHTAFLTGGTNISSIPLTNDLYITGTHIFEDILMTANSAASAYPSLDDPSEPSPIQMIFIQTSSEKASSESITCRTAIILWYEDRKTGFDVSAIRPIYNPYFPNRTATCVEDAPVGLLSLTRSIKNMCTKHIKEKHQASIQPIPSFAQIVIRPSIQPQTSTNSMTCSTSSNAIKLFR
jgi:hypothetical protein